MSSIEVKGRTFRVKWREGGKQLSRGFVTLTEAQEFRLTLPNPSGRRGRVRRSRTQVIDHLAANFVVTEDGCWLWTGALTNAGYGRMNWQHENGFNVPGAHRVVLHAIGQRVPADLVVDHLCRVRHCINPDHLDVVVQRENIMRSPIAPGALNAAKTHCANGHPYSSENTYVWKHTTRSTTTRTCKTCQHDYYLRRRAALMGAAS